MRMFAVQVMGSGPREYRWVRWELSTIWSFGVDVGLDDVLAVLAMGARLE
jgi:hypothetical protein